MIDAVQLKDNRLLSPFSLQVHYDLVADYDEAKEEPSNCVKRNYKVRKFPATSDTFVDGCTQAESNSYDILSSVLAKRSKLSSVETFS